ncbi:MAG: hypothetical protein I8H66_13400 [Sphingobacteriia bacterium]|nr:hypothetical protein [Sphingobacteriia bacterium]
MKKYLLGLLVAAFALGTSAFTSTNSKGKLSTTAVMWQYYPNLGPTTDKTAYVEVTTGNPGLECGGSTILCKILANPDSGTPQFPDLSNGDPGDTGNNYSQQFRNE